MYNYVDNRTERGISMKQLLGRLSPITVKTAVFGAVLVISAVIASAVLYFGAGRNYDYFAARAASEALLNLSRPMGVIVCLAVYFAEYRSKNYNT
jgi:hypothetical protein